MSYQNGSADQDTYWRHKQTNGAAAKNGLTTRINDLLSGDSNDLPMYKDKPHYPTSRRRKWWLQKRPLAVVGLVVLGFLWLTGTLPFTGSRATSSSNSSERKTYSKDPRLWKKRREAVKDVFKTSWSGYEKYAWGMDEYHPISKSGRNMVEGGMGWMIVDALDTAIIMNLTEEVAHAREWITTSLSYTADHDVNTFETTIRMLGGLLSAYYLSTTYPHLAPQLDDDALQPGVDLYIEKATDLADRLLGAYDTSSGIPLASVNLAKSEGLSSSDGLSSTAEAATLQLEMKYLSKTTGEPVYWQRSEHIIKVIDDQQMEGGLVPIFMHPASGTFRGQNIRLGSRGDSYYEYLIKQFLQTKGAEPIYKEMWDDVLQGIKQHLITWTKHSNLCIVGERPSGLSYELSPKMDHLVAFLPGTIALGLTNGSTVAEAKARLGPLWTAQYDTDLRLAEELMKTFWGMYKATPTGLAPEISYFHIDDPPRRWNPNDDPAWRAPYSDDLDEHAPWRADYDIHANDVHNLQRPETAESLFYMYHITQDPMYREWGWEMFESFCEHTKVVDEVTGEVYAYTSLGSVMEAPVGRGGRRDNMESFWLAETLKYLYLLFSDLGEEGGMGLFGLEDVVINTEGHVFPRFGIEGSKVWKTGWERKVRGAVAGAGAGVGDEEQQQRQQQQKPVDLGAKEHDAGEGAGGLDRKGEASGRIVGEPVGVGVGDGDSVDQQSDRLEQKIAEMERESGWEDTQWVEGAGSGGEGGAEGESEGKNGKGKQRKAVWGEGTKLADRDAS